jgi:hypothetical protein
MSVPSSPVVAATKKSRCHAPGGVTLGQDNSHDARKVAAVILEVLAGLRTPAEAASALSVGLPRYYHLEGRALRGLLTGCEAKPRGRVRGADQELTKLRKEHERLQRDLARQQTLVRVARRNMGITAVPAATPGNGKGTKKRRRKPVARALKVVAHLQQQEPATTDNQDVPASVGT